MGKTLALFDFDGTITRGDSLIVFLRHMVGVSGALKGAPETLLRWSALLLQGRLSHSTAKEALLMVHMQRRSRAEWEQAVVEFCHKRRPDYFNPEVMHRLHELQKEGAIVSIVSASIDIWLQPFADELQANMICTQSKWQNDRWIGFASPNCRKEEKVRRVRENYNLAEFDHIIAFGNTSSDYEMLDLAHEAWLVRRGGRLVRYSAMGAMGAI